MNASIAQESSSMRLGYRFGGVAAIALLALGACKKGDAPEPAAAKQAAIAQCEGTDTHTRHVNQFACESCHPRGGEFAPGGTLPDGTPITGTITVAPGTTTTCTVTCHGPNQVAWNQQLSCVSCHTDALLAGARSAHVTSSERAACVACHDTSAHMSGTVKLVVGDGTPGNPACLACHSGSGKPIDGKTPPRLVEFGAAGADAHGDGGVEPARGCADCHDPHASTNAFLLGRRADATPLPPDSIASRAGVGAEALCGRCHATRHQSCLVTCHAHMPGGHTVDPVANGQPCFACHGHEGIVRGDERLDADGTPITEYWGFFDPAQCKHCHDTNLPANETTPPAISAPIFSNDGVGSVTVAWSSNEPASSWIEVREVGGADAVRVEGNAQLRVSHSVQVPGLGAGLPYQVRIRSWDRMRNLALGVTESVTLGAPSTPRLNAASDNLYSCTPTAPVLLTWTASSDPNGDPLAYEIQVATVADFASLVHSGTSAVGATSYTVTLAAPGTARTYYWRMRARDPQALLSTWSATDDFYLRQYVDESCFY